MADIFCSMEQKSSWSQRGEPSAFSLHFRVMHTCIPGFQSGRTLEERLFLEHILCTQVERSREKKKKVKAWVREINEELIYRECRTPPQQSREKQGRIAAPLESGKERTSSHLPSDRHCCDTGMGVSMGTAPPGQLSNSTGFSHHVHHGHIRQTLCMTRNMEETGQLWGYSHLTTASQVTPARAFPLSHHVPICTYIKEIQSCD